ncbi:hypothetical protein [Streptomyces sp. NPDC057909]|uniref:hypothetical protein n=1 Tax=Streptomyces sp. NPDC057909 TaxID=3346277 RepID=UPI0036E47166
MTSTGSTIKNPQIVLPADFEPFLAAITEALSDGWSVDDEQSTGLTAFLAHADGRRIGIRHVWRGRAVQTWAIDVPPHEFDEERDKESYAESLGHLTPGIRYNAAVMFTTSPPAMTTADTIRARLLPAFDGVRPALRAFPRKRLRTGADANTAAAATATKKATKPKPRTRGGSPAKPAAVKTPAPSSHGKQAQPTAEKAAAPAKPGRTTATNTKSAKPRIAKAQQPTENTSTN